VDVESSVAPVEDLPHQGKADELFPEQQGEDLMGEDLLDDLVMETRDTVKRTIRGCASFGDQNMDMGMEVDAVTEGLHHGHHSRHKLKTCGSVHEFHKRLHCRETERIEELSLEAEKQTQHLRNGKDHLAMRDIQQKLLPHPLSPLLTALGMTRRAESACLAGKHKQALFLAVGTPDAGKPAHRIAAVKVLLHNLLDDWPEEAVLLLEPILIFTKEPLEIVKKHAVKHRVLRMTLAVDPCHGREDDS